MVVLVLHKDDDSHFSSLVLQCTDDILTDTLCWSVVTHDQQESWVWIIGCILFFILCRFKFDMCFMCILCKQCKHSLLTLILSFFNWQNFCGG